MISDKPYYMRPPLDVFFKITKLESINPWTVNIAQLLISLLQEMSREGVDFRLAGTAVNSSGIIYQRQADQLLKLEEPPTVTKEKEEPYIPPALSLPLRFELTSTTLADLIQALEKALLEEELASSRPKTPILPEPVYDLPPIDQWLVEIQDRMEDLLRLIKQKSLTKGSLLFSSLVEGLDRLGYVRTFLLLLFLAQSGEIDLQQEEDSNDIEIFVEVVK